jgi:N-acetyl sugar amidotransferase
MLCDRDARVMERNGNRYRGHEGIAKPVHRAPKKEHRDLRGYEPGNNAPEAYYGLPENVAFCKRCVISNQRPNSAVEFQHTRQSRKPTIRFTADGVCDACLVAEQKANTDWAAREAELQRLCAAHRRHDGHYDCLVPGSGGKDSFYAAHLLKTRYGMHPLTVTWAPHIYTAWGWANHQAWIHAGFDNLLMTPNGRVHRLLTRLAVENLFHPFQPFILGQKSLAPKMALRFDIPLIFYGENEAEYGNPIEDGAKALRSWRYYASESDEHLYLGGESVRVLKEDYGLEAVDLAPYMPANAASLADRNVQVHYLGYYLKWHPQSCYYYAVEHGGFQASPERTPGTYSKYNSIDDRIDDFHYYTTWIKFGIGRASYDAAQEIRSGDITREEGVALVRRFDGEWPSRFEGEIFRYLSLPASEFPQAARMFEQPIVDRAYFDALADRFRSPHLWSRVDGQWQLRRSVFTDGKR